MAVSTMRAVLALLLLLAAVPARAQDDAERLRIHGSYTMGQALVPALVEDWLRTLDYRQIRRVPRAQGVLEIHASRDGEPLVVEIAGRGAAAGFAALVDGRSELAMLTRPPTARERDAGWQLGDLDSPDQQFLVALNAARVVVHRDNPLQGIDVAQLRALLAGQARDWSALGGRGGAVRVHLGPPGGGLDGFLRERLGRELRP
ncbi:MAG TPA: substrate-binding domain-containing protein, partial [Pseudoxanthomonas sp.]|nr:substrate-binding domain-containing protein [Pseudoxanthomonas sp.]